MVCFFFFFLTPRVSAVVRVGVCTNCVCCRVRMVWVQMPIEELEVAGKVLKEEYRR